MAAALRISQAYRMTAQPIAAVVDRIVSDLERRREARNSLPPKLRVLVPDPDHDRVHGLAANLAKPVVRGWMRGSHAYAAVALQALKLPDGEQLLPSAWNTLRNHVAWHIRNREETAQRIQIALRPLIAGRARRNVLLAEAHGINGSAGFPFSEEEIRPIVVAEVWWALPTAPRHRYGR